MWSDAGGGGGRRGSKTHVDAVEVNAPVGPGAGGYEAVSVFTRGGQGRVRRRQRSYSRDGLLRSAGERQRETERERLIQRAR